MDNKIDWRAQRLYVDCDLTQGASLPLEGKKAHYLLNVLRLKGGERLYLFNGRDGEWQGEFAPKGRKACELVLLAQTHPQPQPYDLVYCFAPLKQARLDYMAQKAVEMGAGELQPVITDYTQVRTLNLERMRANMIEAAEQCGILSIPALNAPLSLKRLVDEWALRHKSRYLIFCDELADLQTHGPARLEALQTRPAALLIGPEGGFSPSERSLLHNQPFSHILCLGPRILRADTAAVAALALVQAFLGDLK